LVADVAEQRDGLARAIDGIAAVTSPQGHAREQHVHHANCPTIARLLSLDRDVFGNRGGFVQATLVVANPREQSVRPPKAAPIAELTEQVSRLLQPFLGDRGVAVRERDPRQVLQRPRAAAVIAAGFIRGKRLGHESVGLDEIAAEHIGHAEAAQHVGGAALVAKFAVDAQRFSERLLGDVVRA
jgi:hypothetical protein